MYSTPRSNQMEKKHTHTHTQQAYNATAVIRQMKKLAMTSHPVNSRVPKASFRGDTDTDRDTNASTTTNTNKTDNSDFSGSINNTNDCTEPVQPTSELLAISKSTDLASNSVPNSTPLSMNDTQAVSFSQQRAQNIPKQAPTLPTNSHKAVPTSIDPDFSLAGIVDTPSSFISTLSSNPNPAQTESESETETETETHVQIQIQPQTLTRDRNKKGTFSSDSIPTTFELESIRKLAQANDAEIVGGAQRPVKGSEVASNALPDSLFSCLQEDSATSNILEATASLVSAAHKNQLYLDGEESKGDGEGRGGESGTVNDF